MGKLDLNPNPSSSLVPSFRALLIGTLGSMAIGAGVAYGNMVIHGSRVAVFFNTIAAVILLFFLLLFINPLLGLLRRSWMLGRAELALIYIMWIVATSISERGGTAFLLPDITSAIYYATPENNWRELVLPLIPEWLIFHRDFDQVKYFYEGAPAGHEIPWGLWLRPLAYWIPFLMAVFVSMVATMAILRKQWVERERLVFPLAQVAIAMAEDHPDKPELLKPFFKNWVMWMGFAIPFIFQVLNGLNHYFPFIPRIELRTGIPLFQSGLGIPVGVSFQTLGLCYFLNQDIAFGLWVFFLLNVVQRGIFGMIGIDRYDPMLGAYSHHGGGAIVVHQGFGALIVLVIFGLWNARSHLRQVLRKAFRGDGTIDDSAEILSYRAAVFTLVGCYVFMGIWIWQSGMPGWITPIYLFLVLINFIGITRVVSEAGMPVVFAPIVVSDFVAAGFGTRALGSSGIMAIAFTYVWCSDIHTFVMAACANGLKVAEEAIKKARRLIFWGILIALIATLFSSLWTILELAYQYGGINTDKTFFVGAARYPFDNAAVRLQTLEGPHWINWGATAIGAGIMGLLMLARQRFLWWPLHPLGFPVSSAFDTIVFSVFLSWLIKAILLKYGGLKLYLKLRPFFLGLILGHYIPAGAWYAIDYFTGTSGNVAMFMF